MAKWWERLKDGVAQANAPRLDGDVDPVDNEPRRGRGSGSAPAAAPLKERERYPSPERVPDAVPGLVHLDAGLLMAEGDVLAVGQRTVRQEEPGKHAWVIAIWYGVDPLELRDGGRFSLLPDQVIGTLPPACYFCETQWSFQAMRIRCPGKPPPDRR